MTETLPTIEMDQGESGLKVGGNTVVTVRFLDNEIEPDQVLRVVDNRHGSEELWRGSPLGLALEGKEEGEEVLVQLPSGDTVLVQIIAVDPA